MQTNTDDLRNDLQQGYVNVTFTKKDGTERVMKSTTCIDLIPEQFRPKPKPVEEENQFTVNKPTKEDPDLFKVYTPDGWRSFRVDQVISYEVLSNV